LDGVTALWRANERRKTMMAVMESSRETETRMTRKQTALGYDIDELRDVGSESHGQESFATSLPGVFFPACPNSERTPVVSSTTPPPFPSAGSCSSALDAGYMGSMDHDEGSSTATAPTPPPSGTANISAVDKGADFANYFCTYGFLYHQKEMLSDRVRMDAYYNAVFDNAPEHIRGKVRISSLVFLRTSCLCVCLLFVLIGRSKPLRVVSSYMSFSGFGGARMSSLRMISNEASKRLVLEFTFACFDVVCCRYVFPILEFRCPANSFPYFCLLYIKTFSTLIQTSLWNNVHPNQVIGSSVVIKEIDCLKATVEEIRNITAKFSSTIGIDRTQISGFAGWFDVHFRGNEQNPARHEVELTTAPSIEDCTHWGQQVFLLHSPLRVSLEDNVDVSFTMSRSKQYHRLMDVEITTTIHHKSSGKSLRPVSSKFYIE
ncbi:hypothetical protein Taro_039332, partial [Colocasia esculenta]|nr:hypothetical protein [Colocasia esculenta]